MGTQGLKRWWEADGGDEDQIGNHDSIAPEKRKEFKIQQVNQIGQVAKKQRMTTDIKKAVFQAIISAEDYLHAFENCQRLNLKKQ